MRRRYYIALADLDKRRRLRLLGYIASGKIPAYNLSGERIPPKEAKLAKCPILVPLACVRGLKIIHKTEPC
jgi:hypothetical protein